MVGAGGLTFGCGLDWIGDDGGCIWGCIWGYVVVDEYTGVHKCTIYGVQINTHA